MDRNIIYPSDIASSSTAPHDTTSEDIALPDVKTARRPVVSDRYMTRLFKYIPAEVILLYVTLEGILKSAKLDPSTLTNLEWIICCFCFVGTPLYLRRVARVKRPLQLIVSTLSFAVWIFAIGGPFTSLAWYEPIYGALLLPAFSFSVPLITGKKD